MSVLSGLIAMQWWGYLLVALAVTHITIISVTLYLHRHQAHRALEMSPLLSHFFRLWLWMTTGMVTKQWVAIHRKHHDAVESNLDPHSPRVYGIKKVMWEGAELYRQEAACEETSRKYGQGTPDDWLESNVYSKYPTLGISLMFIIQFALFGVLGIAIWAVQMIWIPFWAAGVINGLGHWWGYRNFECRDNSTNVSPIGILIGGEELHNNHHAFANSARFSNRWWEFDIGWLYLCVLRAVGLVKINKVAPKPLTITSKHSSDNALDIDTLRAILANRQYIMASYCRDVIRRVCTEEMGANSDYGRTRLLSYAARFAMHHKDTLGARVKGILEIAGDDPSLQVIYKQKAQLQELWEQRAGTVSDMESLLQNLSDWCQSAEKSGVEALREFAYALRSYRPLGSAG